MFVFVYLSLRWYYCYVDYGRSTHTHTHGNHSPHSWEWSRWPLRCHLHQYMKSDWKPTCLSHASISISQSHIVNQSMYKKNPSPTESLMFKFGCNVNNTIDTNFQGHRAVGLHSRRIDWSKFIQFMPRGRCR